MGRVEQRGLVPPSVRYNPDAESRIFRTSFIHIQVYVRDDQIAM